MTDKTIEERIQALLEAHIPEEYREAALFFGTGGVWEFDLGNDNPYLQLGEIGGMFSTEADTIEGAVAAMESLLEGQTPET